MLCYELVRMYEGHGKLSRLISKILEEGGRKSVTEISQELQRQGYVKPTKTTAYTALQRLHEDGYVRREPVFKDRPPNQRERLVEETGLPKRVVDTFIAYLSLYGRALYGQSYIEKLALLKKVKNRTNKGTRIIDALECALAELYGENSQPLKIFDERRQEHLLEIRIKNADKRIGRPLSRRTGYTTFLRMLDNPQARQLFVTKLAATFYKEYSEKLGSFPLNLYLAIQKFKQYCRQRTERAEVTRADKLQYIQNRLKRSIPHSPTTQDARHFKDKFFGRLAKRLDDGSSQREGLYRRCLDELREENPKYTEVIMLKFIDRTQSSETVGIKIGRTRECVRQLLYKALERLNYHVELSKLESVV